jgi:glutamine phosphoribosylpyrophosphate amidotransferase
MCAVLGFSLQYPSEEQLQMIKRAFIESWIRGMHATGMTFDSFDTLVTLREPVNALKFSEEYFNNMKTYVDSETGKLSMIGHCRYSTSDLQFNQPIEKENVSIVHNGVISQELPENWETLYGYKCETRNDTELVLQTIIDKKSPLEVWKDSSLAVIELHQGGIFRFYRNGKRPLYLTRFENGFMITSTKDIPSRVGIKEIPKLIDMNVYYDGKMKHKVDIDGAIDYQNEVRM